MSPPDGEARLRAAVNELADQLCVAVDGDFDFVVRVAAEDEAVEKLSMLVNFVLDTARRGTAELEERVRARTLDLATANRELTGEIQRRKLAQEALARTEEQLRQAQKMEAIGRLAGGVAHDFNNLLSVVLSYSAMILDDLPPEAPLRADVEEIQKAGERAADVTRQLLAFSRQQMLAPQVLDLNEAVGAMRRMNDRIVGEDVAVRMVLAPTLHKVKADPSQIEQIIMNLVVSARDAMPRGGTITIETRNVEVAAALVESHPGAAPGPHAMLLVSDTGIGMDGATQARIFEPFFTTKQKGKGTGLGLSTVFGIVRQHGGTISVRSEVGAGTTFEVCLPRSGEGPTRATPPSNPPPSMSGSETVLLVEDEEEVRVVVRNVLTRAGYNVLDAPHPGAAILECEQFPGAIHVLLTDIVMPQMNGRELAQRLAPLRPRMRVIFMSGYTDDALVHHDVLDADVAFIQKPITPPVLLRMVRDVLEGRPAPEP